MPNRVLSPVPLMLALALTLAAAPAMAQGRGNGNGNGKGKTEQVRRGDEARRPVLQRRDRSDRDDSRVETRRRDVPPGWCQGKGNPHNTVANCGYSSDRYDAWGSRGGSYEQNHAEFHRYLDDRYRTLAAQRPLDVRRQLELRAQKSAEHERWHDQAGRGH